MDKNIKIPTAMEMYEIAYKMKQYNKVIKDIENSISTDILNAANMGGYGITRVIECHNIPSQDDICTIIDNITKELQNLGYVVNHVRMNEDTFSFSIKWGLD